MRNWEQEDWIMAFGVGALLVGLGYRLLREVNVLGGPWSIVDMSRHSSLTDRAQRAYRKRDPGVVKGVVLHQMGFSRGNDPMRYRRVTAHYIVLPDGGIYKLWGFDDRLPSSNGFNGNTVAIEFAGNFPSRPQSTDPKHFWNPSAMGMNQLTVAQALAGRYLLSQLHKRGVRFVVSHAQSNDGKGNDPGPDIWGAVGAYGVRALGMSSDGIALRFPGKSGGLGSGLPEGTPGGAGRKIKQLWWDAADRWDQILAAA